jgi:hypothetical protein
MWYHTATIVLLATFARPGNPAGVPSQIVPVDKWFRKKFAEGSGKILPMMYGPVRNFRHQTGNPPFNGGPPTGIPDGFLE